ncbi:MAG: hypothetical protein KDI79_03440 [Anaerolineae bacterium]|nr:hypothetical protein [Anaerolineae bacterium]
MLKLKKGLGDILCLLHLHRFGEWRYLGKKSCHQEKRCQRPGCQARIRRVHHEAWAVIGQTTGFDNPRSRIPLAETSLYSTEFLELELNKEPYAAERLKCQRCGLEAEGPHQDLYPEFGREMAVWRLVGKQHTISLEHF